MRHLHDLLGLFSTEHFDDDINDYDFYDDHVDHVDNDYYDDYQH